MAKTSVSDWDTNAAGNTDIDGHNIDENCSPAGINNAIRSVMSQIATLDPPGSGATETVSGDWTITGTWDMSGATLTMPTALEVLNGSSITGISGSDVTLITGTAGTADYVAKWNADGDLVDGFEVLDEDDMSSDSATKLATQQSIKAYVDATGDMVELDDSTLSGDTDYQYTTLTGYSAYLIILENITPGTDGSELRIRTSSNAGSSYDSGSSDYEYATSILRVGSSDASDKSAGANNIILTGNIGNASGEGSDGEILITSAGVAAPTKMRFDISSKTSSGDMRSYRGHGWRAASATIDAVQIRMNSGTISGRIIIKGIR